MANLTCTEANPCGDQSCIVARRKNGDYVHEDSVFGRHGLPLRATCDTHFTPEQIAVLKAEMQGYHSVVIRSGISGASKKKDGSESESDDDSVGDAVEDSFEDSFEGIFEGSV